jgi:hypothetical protein
MDSQEQDCSINKQICSGCYKILPIELYFHNKTNKQFRTCIHCRTKSKNSKRLQKSNSDNAEPDEPVIQFTNFDEFLDFYSEQLEEFARNKENVEDFRLNIVCIVNSFLFDGLSKETANQITKQVSDIDEYSWM